jgi:guanylate kinase
MPGILFIVSAPSGAGKTSLVAALIQAEPTVKLSISHTTRPPRASEVDGRDYHFVAAAEFERMLEAGAFLESATIYGHQYGTSQQWVTDQLATGQDILLEIDWQGAQQVRRKMQESVNVFVLPPSLDALGQRLRARSQDSPDAIARRLAAAREDISHFVEFDYVIMNDDFDRAAQDLASIVRAERLRLRRQLARHADSINRMK